MEFTFLILTTMRRLNLSIALLNFVLRVEGNFYDKLFLIKAKFYLPRCMLNMDILAFNSLSPIFRVQHNP